MTSTAGLRIEVVRGRLDAETAQRLIHFWTGHRALEESEARERLSEVVCVLFDLEGEIVGVNSAYAANAPLVGRRFWIYRRFLAPGVDEEVDAALIASAREALAAEFTGAATQPIGLCVVIRDQALIERRPEAEWPDVGLLFAGWTPAGAQVRIGYFDGARV